MKQKDVIIALDFKDKAETLAFLDRITEEKPFVKIGMELFYGTAFSWISSFTISP